MPTRILFAGGGTGGHVFPGIALAQLALSEGFPAPSRVEGLALNEGVRPPSRAEAHAVDAQVFWLCTSRPFDAAQLTREGIPFEALPSPRWKGFSGFLGPLAKAILDAARCIRRFRPHVLVGVGGYGTVPPALAARALGLPFVLLEQNARPGKANRFLAPAAGRIYVQWVSARSAFPGCGSRVVATGSPLRAQLRRMPRAQALKRFGFDADRPTLVVVGGSQGAEALNRGAVAGLDGMASKIQVIHVTGPGRVEGVRDAYREKGARAVVFDFVADMDALYSAADLLVSRAGAMAIAEIAAFEVPSVLVPIPRSSGDHQRENARAVARAGGAVLMEEADCLAGGLAPLLRKLVSGDAMFDNMREHLKPFARPRAARAILDDLGEFLIR